MAVELADLPQEVQSIVDHLSVELTPTAPQQGVDRYLNDRRGEIEQNTQTRYRERLGHFTSWCEQQGIENLNDLTGADVNDFRVWRRDESSDAVDQLAPKTIRGDMLLLRDTLRYLESNERVPRGVASKLKIPTLPRGAGIREYGVEDSQISEILEYLATYRYASAEHVVWMLQCKTGRRPGGLRALDVQDVYVDAAEPYLSFRHREGTPLKKDEDSEGEVSIGADVARVLRDYLSNERPEVTDDLGREPLLASTQGRLAVSTMRRYFYRWSRPCVTGAGCPHNRDPETCEAAQTANAASKCPSTFPPYATRHGHITQLRREGLPVQIISERCDVSAEVLLRHYDESSESDRRAIRSELLGRTREGSDKGGFL